MDETTSPMTPKASREKNSPPRRSQAVFAVLGGVSPATGRRGWIRAGKGAACYMRLSSSAFFDSNSSGVRMPASRSSPSCLSSRPANKGLSDSLARALATKELRQSRRSVLVRRDRSEQGKHRLVLA